MDIEKEILKIRQDAKAEKLPSPNRIDLTDIIAGVKDLSMELPKNRIRRQEIMRKIAEGFQRKQGNFFFGQIYDILETAYPNAVASNTEQIVQEIDDWVSNDPSIEFIGEENGFYYYRLR